MMWRFFILISTLISITTSFIPGPQYEQNSVASEAQIRFAIENKYDDTGPGAKEPEYAYHTYKTLEDALVSYLDDPDTKLPEFEREQALARLQGNADVENDYSQPIRQLPKKVGEYTSYTGRPLTQFVPQQVQYDTKTNYAFEDVSYPLKTPPKKFLSKVNDGVSYQKFQAIDPPQAYASNTDIHEVPHDQFDPNPKYSFSYGVHDKNTGDSKSAHETREGGTVRGYYTFLDADGKQRTVHYSADDKQGFRATVERTDTHANTQ